MAPLVERLFFCFLVFLEKKPTITIRHLSLVMDFFYGETDLWPDQTKIYRVFYEALTRPYRGVGTSSTGWQFTAVREFGHVSTCSIFIGSGASGREETRELSKMFQDWRHRRSRWPKTYDLFWDARKSESGRLLQARADRISILVSLWRTKTRSE